MDQDISFGSHCTGILVEDGDAMDGVISES